MFFPAAKHFFTRFNDIKNGRMINAASWKQMPLNVMLEIEFVFPVCFCWDFYFLLLLINHKI